MPTPPLTDALAAEAIEAYERNGQSCSAAAKELGIHRATFQSRLKTAHKRAMQMSEGAREQVQLAGLSGTEAVAGWRHSYLDGKKVGATYWKAPNITEQDNAKQIDTIRAAFEDMEPAPIVATPRHCESDLMTLYPIADAHIGMMAWGEETGEDYDTKIATARLTSWIARAIASSPSSETAVILDIGDLTHADDQTNQTQKSKHILDVDTRHFKTLDMTIQALATAIELAKAKHARVIVRILPGNHNPTTYMTILFAICERYRNEDRVQVQKVPGEFFIHQFGKCLIAAHHGDKAKAERIVLFLADQYAQIWGNTVHRFLWTGHLHHHKSQDIGGVQWEQLRAITAKDAWASSHGYTARAQLQAITYHRERGEVQRVKVAE